MSNTVWKSKQRFTKIQNEKEFRSHSNKMQCNVFSLYRTLHEVESSIESTTKTKTE